MKSWKILALLLFLVIALTACAKVPAGNVGIKVYLLGKSKGVDSEELGPGRYWIGWNEDLFLFPTFTQNYVWTKDPTEGSKNNESITFQTVEGLSVNADVGISYHIKPKKVNTIFQKYRRGVNEITDVFLRNMVRDAFVDEASTRAIESVYGKGKSDLLAAVEKQVREQVAPLGIVVERIYIVGSLRLPNSVVKAINLKIQAKQIAQQRENEVAEAKANARKQEEKAKGKAKAILAVAEAQAAANRKLAASLTPELVQAKAIEKWDGKLPQLTGGGAVPFINVDRFEPKSKK